MLEVHAILHRQRCNENMTEKTGTLSDAYKRFKITSETHSKHILMPIQIRHYVSPSTTELEPRLEPTKNKPLKVLDFQGL